MAPQPSKNVLDNYVTVAERIGAFYNSYPNGRICTQIVEHDAESGFILMRAEVFRGPDDAQPAATGHAFEVRNESYVNKTSYIENCETGCVGRALALLGFEVKRGIASREEVEKAERMQETAARAAATPPPPPPRGAAAPPAAAPANDEEEVPAVDLDAEILHHASELGYDAPKVLKWINQKYDVTGGLNSLTMQDKRDVLKVFREKVGSTQAKPATSK